MSKLQEGSPRFTSGETGSALVPVIILIVIVLISTIVFLKPFSDRSSTSINNTFQETKDKIVSQSNRSDDEPPLLLKSIGVNLDYYDSQTKKAGDFLFTKKDLQFDRPFMGYGFVIPSNISSTGQSKANPQPTFILPLGTKVRSLVDGVVANVPKLYSGDYSIQVSANGKVEKWLYETEHVINPLVKVGDQVKAGQEIAEVSDYDRNLDGFGIVEIGILKGGNPPQHICPFAYLDPSTKEETFKKLKAFYKSWEEYIGDTTLYDENEPIPGCVSLDPIKG